MPILPRTFAGMLCILFSLSVHAAATSFNVSTGDWNVPGNWTTGVVPGAGDSVTIPDGRVCTVSDTRACLSLSLTGGRITVNGSLTVPTLLVSPSTSMFIISGTGDLTVTSAFSVASNGTISGSGRLIIASGATMSYASTFPYILDAHTILVQSGGTLTYAPTGSNMLTMSNGATVSIESGGTFNINSINQIAGTATEKINNAGTLSFGTGTGTNTVGPACTNSGDFNLSSGHSATFSNGIVNASGTIHLDATLTAPVLNIDSGLLFGFGTVNCNLNHTGGTVRPGSGVGGDLHVAGNYTQGVGAQLLIDVESPVSGEGFGRLIVTNDVSLGGQLSINLVNGFVPMDTDTFLIVDCLKQVSGAFTSVLNGGSGFGPTYAAQLVTLVKLANVISVDLIDATPDPARTGGDTVFTATVSNPGGATLTYNWNFGDGTTGTGNPVTKVFTPTVDQTYMIGVEVFDGQQTVSGSTSIMVMTGNAAGSGSSVSQGKNSTNPLSGLMVGVTASDAGLVELTISETGASTRANSDTTTTFADDSTSLPSRVGNKVVQKFTNSSVYVASTTVKNGDGSVRSRGRKTIPVSAREVGTQNSAITEPQNRELLLSSLKGKFVFKVDKDRPDTVTFNGSFEVPGGLDLSTGETLVFAMGNVVDSVQVDKKGKAILPSTAGVVKKLKVKFPRLNRKNPVTEAGQIAKIQATYFTKDLDLAGFDTEGITNRVLDSEAGQKTVPRSIQMAMNFAGVTYESLVDVQFKLAKKADAGGIVGRVAR
jgi:hypothetical protein